MLCCEKNNEKKRDILARFIIGMARSSPKPATFLIMACSATSNLPKTAWRLVLEHFLPMHNASDKSKEYRVEDASMGSRGETYDGSDIRRTFDAIITHS